MTVWTMISAATPRGHAKRSVKLLTGVPRVLITLILGLNFFLFFKKRMLAHEFYFFLSVSPKFKTLSAFNGQT